jgi:hypothetical protein
MKKTLLLAGTPRPDSCWTVRDSSLVPAHICQPPILAKSQPLPKHGANSDRLKEWLLQGLHHRLTVVLGLWLAAGCLPVWLCDAHAQTTTFVTIAHTGQAGLTSIDRNVSINDAGLVAFAGQTAQGRTAYVGNGSALTAVLAPSTGDFGSMVRDRVYINNLNQVLMLRGVFAWITDPVIYYDPFGILPPWVVSPGSIDTSAYLQFRPATGGGSAETIARVFVHQEYDFITYPPQKLTMFWSLGPDFCANNVGQVAFMADQGNDIVSSNALFTVEAPSSYVYLPLWSGARPVLADDGTIVVRSGSTASDPIVMLDYLMNTVQMVAGPSMGFTALGVAPGISDDGKFIAFYGNLSAAGATNLATTPGPGIFLSAPATGGRHIIRVAGVTPDDCSTGLTSFQADSRVAVNNQSESLNEALVVFVANDRQGSGIFASRYKLGAAGATYPAPVVRQGDTPNGFGPVTQFALYDSVNTQGQIAFWTTGNGESVLVAQAPPRVPVILVHGWRPDPQVWNDLIASLESNQIPHSEVILEDGGKHPIGSLRPDLYVGKVAAEFDSYRNRGYRGKVDVVCHSMGAMVTRLAMERDGYGSRVRQWIGIAPVNQGAALADLPGMFPFTVLGWIVGLGYQDMGGDGAITGMRTDSAAAQTLASLPRSTGVIYRVLVGYNPCLNDDLACQANLSRDFHNPHLGHGKTFARIIDERGVVHPHAWTHYGDSVVALVQSQLPGAASTDCFPNLGHTALPRDQGVIDLVVKYLLNPCAASLNNCPATADLLRDADVQTIGAGNHGIIFMAEQHTHSIPVGMDTSKLTASLDYGGSQLALTLFTPSGTLIVPGSYPVLEYSNAPGSVWYVIDSPAAGIWSARVDAVDVPTNGEPYSLVVSFVSPEELLVTAGNGGQPVWPGQSVPLLANFHNGTNAIIGASVSAEVAAPSGQNNSLQFYDDGTHGDSVPGDGIYSATWSPNLLGLYTLTITASAGLVQRTEVLQLEVQPPAAPPILAARRTGPSVQITWTAAIGAYLLEGCTNLAAPTWLAEGTVPEVRSNYIHTVTLSSSGPRYFRLRGSNTR